MPELTPEQQAIYSPLASISEAVELEMKRVTEPNQAKVILFKESGKYYTEEWWTIPEGTISGPYDMYDSPDFRRIGNGKVLVVTQEPWGYPHLL